MKNANGCLLILILLTTSGCQQNVATDQQPPEVSMTSEDNPFAINDSEGDKSDDDQPNSTEPDEISREDMPFDTWEQSGQGMLSLSGLAAFEIGDLVPCPREFAEFSLDIEATYDGNGFYIFKQTFCHFRDDSFDPSNQKGMNPYFTSLSDLIGGSMSGNYFYPKLTPESATIRVNWKVSQKLATKKFETEFEVIPKKNGTVELGDKKSLQWSFKQIVKE